MNDKLENLANVFGANKKTLVCALATYILVMIIVLVIIWWPKENGFNSYVEVNLKTKQEQLAQTYINKISQLFKGNDISLIEDLISDGYVAYVGKDKNTIVNELQNEGFISKDVIVEGMNIYADENIYVFSTKLYSGNKSRTVNLIEKYPYKYELVFDDFYSYDIISKTVAKEGVIFTIDNIYKNLKFIEFNFKIENQNNSYARFDFNSVTGVQAILEDGTAYSVANLVTSEEYTNIESGMTVNKKFVFEIPAQLQEGIKQINFNGVTLEFSSMDIKVEL